MRYCLLLAVVIIGAEALKCYVCKSSVNKKCGVPTYFHEFERECYHRKNGNRFIEAVGCRAHLHDAGGGLQHVVRECAYDGINVNNRLEKKPIGSIWTTQCSQNLCNNHYLMSPPPYPG